MNVEQNYAKKGVLIVAKRTKIPAEVREYARMSNIKIEREDSLDIREKISKMSPEQRKKLRINKSTLWYMKKNLKSGKSIKIYDKTWSKIN